MSLALRTSGWGLTSTQVGDKALVATFGGWGTVQATYVRWNGINFTRVGFVTGDGAHSSVWYLNQPDIGSYSFTEDDGATARVYVITGNGLSVYDNAGRTFGTAPQLVPPSGSPISSVNNAFAMYGGGTHYVTASYTPFGGYPFTANYSNGNQCSAYAATTGSSIQAWLNGVDQGAGYVVSFDEYELFTGVGGATFFFSLAGLAIPAAMGEIIVPTVEQIGKLI